MDQLPIFMNLRGRLAVVVGGGVIASRKAALVEKSGAKLRIVSPEFSAAMQSLATAQGFETVPETFRDEHVEGATLVIAATDCPDVNRAVHRAAVKRNIPVNVVDTPELCTFILPAIVDRSPVTVAVSTGGRSPVLARFVKALLERSLPTQLGRLASFLGELRSSVKAALPDGRVRRRFWEDLLETDVPELVYAGRHDDAARRVRQLKFAAYEEVKQAGRVYLIGAGPGDPELLTIRAQRLLQRADVVLYDRLVPVGILEMCRREAELVYVGKQVGDHVLPQEDISKLLVRYALQGKRVARLKGGDPFVFGRGGEELECLAEAGIDFEVVPGVSAANGCAAYSGIPLTHRDHAQGVSYYTGHTRNGELDLDWSSMVSGRQTLVFYMGRKSAPIISAKLIEHGMPATTPAAIVEAGTTMRQKVQRCSLHSLPKHAESGGNGLPALIIVGSVVNLRRDLDWFTPDEHSEVPVFPAHQKSANLAGDAGAA